MKVQEMRTDEIRPYENNPRKNDSSVAYVANSIEEFGFQQPIVVDSNGVIIVGHTRYRAAVMLGLKTVPVVIADNLTEEQAKAYRLADNKVSEFSKWDDVLLFDEIDGIFDLDMSKFGFDDITEEQQEETKPVVPFATELDETSDYVVIKIDRDIDFEKAKTIFGLKDKAQWHTNAKGTGGGSKRLCRVVSWDEFEKRFGV